MQACAAALEGFISSSRPSDDTSAGRGGARHIYIFCSTGVLISGRFPGTLGFPTFGRWALDRGGLL